MKRFFIWLLVLCTALTVGISARGNDGPKFLLLEDSSRRLMVLWPDTGLQTLTDQYVLDYHYDSENGILWYTAMEGNQPVLCSIDPWGGQPVYHDIVESEQTLESRAQPGISLFGEPNKTVAQMAQAATEIIVKKEGRYGSINASDNGHGMSVGIMQWHENRALELLKNIIQQIGPQLAVGMLGDALYEDIMTSTSWDERAAQAHELEGLKSILSCAAGKAVQDAIAERDVTGYINYGMNKGLESSLALVYFADVQNQWGSGGAYRQLNKAIEMYSVDACDVTLEMLHTACKAYSSNYHTRRNAVYQECLALGWEEFTVTLRPPQNVTALCSGSEAAISWDPVENAAGYTCRILTMVWGEGYKQVGDLVQTEDPHCSVTLDTAGNYFAEITAWAGAVQSEGSLWAQLDVLETPVICEVALSGVEATISWDMVPSAVRYLCRITDETGQQVCPPVETYDRFCTVSLEAGREYRAFVTARCQGSISQESDGFAFWVPVGAPANVQATARKGNVTVTWAAGEHAQSYRVELLQEGEVVYTADTDRLTHTFAVVPNGDYTARVAALPDPQGVYGEAFVFSVTDTDPQGKLQSEAEVERRENAIAVQVTMFYAEQPCFVLAAGYQEGRMVSIGLARSDPNGNLFLLDGDADEVRVLTVDSLTHMLPLCHLLHIPQTDFFEPQP